MDLGSTIIGITLIFFCIIPFVIMHLNRVKKENQMLQSLTKIANQHNCQISHHEFCGDFVIGIDKIKNFVFFYKPTKEKADVQFIDLADIQNCKVTDISSTITNKDGKHKIIDRLQLSFIPISKNQPEIKLEFYNAEVNLQLSGELQSIEKWSKQINDQLKNKKK